LKNRYHWIRLVGTSPERSVEMLGGLILAGGDGSRFGPESKLVQELGGRPLLEYAISAMSAVSAIDRIVVVLGAHADVVRARVDFGRARSVVCEEWSRGMSETLRFGLRALGPADRVVVMLGDSPTVTSGVVERFVSAPPGSRAVYHGRPGHPVVLGGTQVDGMGSVAGDEGARTLLHGPAIECSDLCSGLDVDTPEDLELVRAAWRTL
jgi:CTP:molybdopterin cytidylyltransferase MocA